MITFAELVGAIIVVLILAFLYEGLKTLRDALMSLEMKKKYTTIQDEKESLLSGAGYVTRCDSNKSLLYKP